MAAFFFTFSVSFSTDFKSKYSISSFFEVGGGL